MTINKVIEQVDELRPSTFSDEQKTAWLSTLDGMIARVVMQQEAAETYSFPEDADRKLRVQPPFDGIYGLYLQAKIALHQGEIEDYNNLLTVFDTQFSEFKKAYIRENRPKSAGPYRNV